MKRIKIKYTALLLLLSLGACENSKYDVMNHQAFIAQTLTNANSSARIVVDESSVQADLNVRLSNPAEEDCVFQLSIDSSVLETYNKNNFTSFKVLDTAQFEMSTTEIKVKKGESLSAPIQFSFKPFTREMKDGGLKYALPIRLEKIKGDAHVLYPGSSFIYIMDPAIITAVPLMDRYSTAYIGLKDKLSLQEWSIEFMVNMSLLGKEIGKLNNQAIFDASSDMGRDDGEIYIRFGDAPIEGNRLQIKTQNVQLNSNLLFEENRWYHLAFVCTANKLKLYVNGKLDNAIDVPGSVVNIGKRDCKLCSSGEWLKSKVKMCELRIWQRALSQREISNNMFATDPSSNGLAVYLKMNEGVGEELKDATGKGNDGKRTGGEPVWIQKVKLN